MVAWGDPPEENDTCMGCALINFRDTICGYTGKKVDLCDSKMHCKDWVDPEDYRGDEVRILRKSW